MSILRRNVTISVLFTVAFLQTIAGIFYGHFYSERPDFGWLEWAFVFSASIYFILGFTARWFRLFSLFIGFGFHLFFGVYLEFLSSRSPHFLADGRLLEVLIFFLFMLAFWYEIKREQTHKGLPPFEIKVFVKLTFYVLGILISIFTLIDINHKLVIMTKFSMPDEMSVSGKAASEMIHSFTERARLDWLLSIFAASVLTLCVYQTLSELSKAKSNLTQSRNLNFARKP
jgi:hypothetical protein